LREKTLYIIVFIGFDGAMRENNNEKEVDVESEKRFVRRGSEEEERERIYYMM